ncbi:GNAT family N-acetyltransferase [Chloroflexota bacterium]
MSLQIRPYIDADLDAIVKLSLLAFEPVFASFAEIMGPEIYPLVYPNWRKSQARDVAETCQDTAKISTVVAEINGAVVGFLCYTLREKDSTGEIYLLAVHPDYQNHDIGTKLNNHALQEMQAAGMTRAEVATGGDDSHAPARRSYEKTGFTALPLVRYYKKL